MAIKRYLFSLTILISTLPCFAVTYINHVVGQFAGEVGLVSLGLGKDFSRYSISGLYGFVPAEYSQGPVIETVTLRQTYEFSHWKRIDFYGGLNIFHVLSLQYNSSQFKDAPSDYYSIGSIRGLIYLGISMNMKPSSLRSFYFETGLNDIWLANWASNTESVTPEEHFSLALGFKQRF